MRVVEVEEPDGKVSAMDRVICPRIRSAAKCPIPLANQRRPKVVKSKAVPEEVGALSRERYETGDFVSLDQYVVKALGRLPTGFGKESIMNMFHGGTIFRYASSKYIHVQNQVSLGAGETVNAKMRFEDWLWETARARVKHYHSDNGVFTAEAFRDSCKEDRQTQSFSGVGAQHQNAEAERAIQTIMYMARSFMIHAALHWGEDGSDDISQWSFAVDHASWLYNHIPQRGSGISPLEMVMQCKSDHRDLMRTHVWGCPVYVLEPSLQNGKKLPKWNRHARMGQFLGFSREHSSTVALVRNLHTGYVSPQYHVVFDDKFETVFNDNKSSAELDKICAELFVSSRECFVEDEYDEDGMLVYRPPPLDEVWLSEPERRERRKFLEEQRNRTARKQIVESREV
jgi:transposase InsO family protein